MNVSSILTSLVIPLNLFAALLLVAQFWQDFARCLRSAKQSSSPVSSEVAL